MPQGNKKLYMWLCVVGTTLVIGLIWAASLKYNLAATVMSLQNTKSGNWKMLENLGGNLEKDYQGMKNVFKQNIITTSTTST